MRHYTGPVKIAGARSPWPERHQLEWLAGLVSSCTGKTFLRLEAPHDIPDAAGRDLPNARSGHLDIYALPPSERSRPLMPRTGRSAELIEPPAGSRAEAARY